MKLDKDGKVVLSEAEKKRLEANVKKQVESAKEQENSEK